MKCLAILIFMTRPFVIYTTTFLFQSEATITDRNGWAHEYAQLTMECNKVHFCSAIQPLFFPLVSRFCISTVTFWANKIFFCTLDITTSIHHTDHSNRFKTKETDFVVVLESFYPHSIHFNPFCFRNSTQSLRWFQIVVFRQYRQPFE